MKRLLAVVLLAVAVATLGGIHVAVAQGGVDVRASTAQNDFPNGISFSLDAAVSGTLDDIRLVYEIAPDGVRATAEPQCTGDATLSCTFRLAGSNRTLLIPGAQVTYFWRLGIDGQTVDTTSQVVTYEDDRFEWQTVSDGNLTLWYYSGGEEEARAVLAAARESLDGISTLLQTTVDFPVKIYYYASAQEMQTAIISNNAEGVVTLGEVVYSDTAMVAADASPEEIARHEIAHIVVRQALSGPFRVPDWLNEGTAVFAQSEPLSGQRQAVENAISNGQVFSVRSLSSASAGSQSDKVFLFYGQSWSLVKFLIDTYGEQSFADLFRAYSDGANTAEALMAVYGFTEDGLENAWRQSVGLPPRQAPTPDDSNAQEPTSTPEQGGQSEDGGDGSSSALLIAAVAVLTIALAAGLVGLGVVLARRSR
jgi:hypothetical protein